MSSLIAKEHRDWNPECFICHDDLNRFRSQYVQDVLTEEKGELTTLEQDVVQSLREHDILTQNLNTTVEEESTIGQQLADRVASFGGSWTFILIFGGVLLVWITINSLAMLGRPFDPFPFILLNLVLSCLAAIQAPVIMMSQNRQESKDRLRAENDYRVNLKANSKFGICTQKWTCYSHINDTGFWKFSKCKPTYWKKSGKAGDES